MKFGVYNDGKCVDNFFLLWKGGDYHDDHCIYFCFSDGRYDAHCGDFCLQGHVNSKNDPFRSIGI